MTTKENLIVVAIEECSEIAKALTKFMRFGKGHEQNNEQDIWIEYYQLKAMFELLTDNHILEPCPDNIVKMIMGAKKKKVERYSDFSRHLGLISDTAGDACEQT